MASEYFDVAGRNNVRTADPLPQGTSRRKNSALRAGFTALVTVKVPPTPKMLVPTRAQLVMPAPTFVVDSP